MGDVSIFNETAHSVFVRERLLPCRVVVGSVDCIVYTDYVYPAFVPLLADISCLLSFQKVLLFCFSLFSSSFPRCVLFCFLSPVYWPFHTHLLACLIRAAIVHFSCRLHLFTSRWSVIASPD